MKSRKSKRKPPVSLYPLTLEESLAGLMQVRPEDKTEDVETTEDDEKEKPEEQQHDR